MSPGTIAALVDGGIPLIGGIYATLIGFRVVGKPLGTSREYDQWHERFGTVLKVCGPMMIAFGIFRVARGLVVGAK